MYIDVDKFSLNTKDLPLSETDLCAYFHDRESRIQYFFSQYGVLEPVLDKLLEAGTRRSGELYYINACPSCKACVPYRLKIKDFKPSRSQKRILKKNKHIYLKAVKPNRTQEKTELYLRYQYYQHHLKPAFTINTDFDEKQNLKIMQHQMYTNTANSIELEFYDSDRLVGFMIIDAGETSLSAVYSVYDIEYYQHSPGNMMILRSIEWGKENNYQYYYPGLYIASHPKMSYKAAFQPAQIFNVETEAWEGFHKPEKIN